MIVDVDKESTPVKPAKPKPVKKVAQTVEMKKIQESVNRLHPIPNKATNTTPKRTMPDRLISEFMIKKPSQVTQNVEQVPREDLQQGTPAASNSRSKGATGINEKSKTAPAPKKRPFRNESVTVQPDGKSKKSDQNISETDVIKDGVPPIQSSNTVSAFY